MVYGVLDAGGAKDSVAAFVVGGIVAAALKEGLEGGGAYLWHT